MSYPIDHVALVVQHLEPVLERLETLERGPIELFPGEGTREVYLGRGTARLLLIQPTDPLGPYARALDKRGPGLHHIGLKVPDLDAFLARVRGWLVVPACVPQLDDTRTAWLARPGVGTLLEVAEGQPTLGREVVEQIELPGDLPVDPRPSLVPSSDGDGWLTITGERLSLRSLTASS